MTRPEVMHAAAMKYAVHGWPVLPCRGKVPLTPHGVLDASTEPAVVADWWSRWPSANIGYAVQPGHVVVDLDREEGLHALAASGFELPATAAVRTARGLHCYYRCERPVASRVGVVPGVDLRASGAYCIAPPSIHPSGAVYRWEVSPRDMADAPHWIFDVAGTDADTAPLREALAEPVTEGRRNDTLCRLAGALLRYVPAPLAVECVRFVNEHHMAPPLPSREVDALLASVMRRELRRREGGTS